MLIMFVLGIQIPNACEMSGKKINFSFSKIELSNNKPMEKLNKKPLRGICFMQEDKGRDTEIVLPIVYGAEKFLNCKIDFRLKWNAHLIYKENPDFVIIPTNCIGSKMYHDIAKYCYRQNIKIFSFISEGNFNDKIEYNYFGFNDDKVFYQEYVCSWSERTQKYIQERSPEQADKIVLTGASGFDRFNIYKFTSKEDFLKKYNKTKYKKVITYAGWAFGKLQYQQGLNELKPFAEKQEKGYDWIEEQRQKVRDSLRYAIENNPDILFVLKQHPAEYFPGLTLEQRNEMSELTHYENVLYIQGHIEGIHDLISVADILLGFETTSAIETWVMGDKPTIFLNDEPNFTRVDIYKGCLLAKDGKQLNDYVSTFYKNGKIEIKNLEYKYPD